MGKQYAWEFKESILKRILPPNNGYIPEISRETGIPVDTLYTWRTKYRSRTLEPGNGKEHESSSLTSEEKLSILLETIALNEVERGEYCRRKGLYPEQIEAWKKAVLAGLSSPSERASRGTVSQQAKAIRHLESELRRKEKALAEAVTLLMLKKKLDALLEEPEVGVDRDSREEIMARVEEGRHNGVRLSALCDLLGLSPRTVQRYRSTPDVTPEDRRKAAQARRVPGNRLTPAKEEAILFTLNQPRFASLSPAQIVPILADEGLYLASESTLYRILRKLGQLAHRGRARVPTRRRPTPLYTTAPNQVWTWDITYLSTTVKGQFFYLYLFLDLYSRKIVGWEVWASESADHAAETLRKAVLRESQGGQAPPGRSAFGQWLPHEGRHHARDAPETGDSSLVRMSFRQ